MINHAATVSTKSKSVTNPTASAASEFASLGRAPLRFTLKSKRITSRDLQIVEATEELLEADVPEPDDVAANVSLLRGFKATMPSAGQSRSRRRQTRNIDAPTLGLKKLGINARELLTEEDDHERASVVSEEDVIVVKKAETSGKNAKSRRTGRTSMGASKTLGKEELKRQTSEIFKDKENIQVRRVSDLICMIPFVT
jgi:mitochondrial division protein 1